MDRYTGNVTATLRLGRPSRLEIAPGPIRVSKKLLAMADGQCVRVDGDVITFTGVDQNDAELRVSYRITGEEADGPEGGWHLCEPIQN